MSEISHVPDSSLQRLPSGDLVERHRHPNHQLIYVSAGVLVVQTSHGSWVASSDRSVWIPSGTWHEHRAHGASTIHTVGFGVDRPPLDVDRPAVITVSPLLRELLVAVGDQELPRAEVTHLRTVLHDQLRRTAHEPISLPAPSDARLARACATALNDLSSPIALSALAHSAGTTERTLSRLFQTQTGMSYPQWRSQARALHAMVLLAEGTTVTETANRCGWSTPSAFIDSFHRIHGHTPGTYRELAADETAAPDRGRFAATEQPHERRASPRDLALQRQ